MNDDMPPRRKQTAPERDLEGSRARRDHGFPASVATAEYTPVTPVMTVLERIGDPEIKMVVTVLWQHTADVEQRMRGLGDELRRRTEQLELGMVDVRGESGANGKLGNVRAELEAGKARLTAVVSRFWALAMLVLGGVGAAAVKLVLIGRVYGDLETQVEANRAAIAQQAAQIQALQALAFHGTPARAPEKDSP